MSVQIDDDNFGAVTGLLFSGYHFSSNHFYGAVFIMTQKTSINGRFKSYPAQLLIKTFRNSV